MEFTSLLLGSALGGIVGAVVAAIVDVYRVRRLRPILTDLVSQEAQTRTAVTRLLERSEQSWYWSPEWQAGEAEADDDLAAGRGISFDSEDEMDAYLDKIPLRAPSHA